MSSLLGKGFNPGLASRFYFIRKGLFEAVAKYAPLLSGRLLDFGCGSKPYMPLFKVDEYIGLDFEGAGHSHANEQIEVYYDGKTIPFADSYFDSILCTEVVEHLFDLDSTLREMNRVLKQEGKILLTCPFVWAEHEQPYDFARYTQFALKDILERNGFRIITYEKRGSFVEAITQMKVIYFVHWAEPKLSRFSSLGYLVLNSCVFFINGYGKFRNWLMPSRYELYLSNIVFAEKSN